MTRTRAYIRLLQMSMPCMSRLLGHMLCRRGSFQMQVSFLLFVSPAGQCGIPKLNHSSAFLCRVQPMLLPGPGWAGAESN